MLVGDRGKGRGRLTREGGEGEGHPPPRVEEGQAGE